MKFHSRALIALLTIAFLAMPTALLAGQILAPMEKIVPPGVTSLHYADQTFVFSTPVALHVKFKPVSSNQFELRFRVRGSYPGQGGGAGVLYVYWEDYGGDLYNGSPPDDEWVGIVNTEGGWTEK